MKKKVKILKYGMKPKREVSDAQFKNQVIFTIKGMQANLRKIYKMFPNVDLSYHRAEGRLSDIITDIKLYVGPIIRKPK